MSLKAAVALTLFLALVFGTATRAQTVDARLMSDADYKAFLSQIETALPRWATALRNIKPENDPQISYAVGQMIVQNRDLALLEIDNIRTWIPKQQIKRTVSGEVALYGFMQSLYDSITIEVGAEAIDNVTLSDIEKFGPEMSAFAARIGNDSTARLELLEKATCSTAVFSSPGKPESSHSENSIASVYRNNRVKRSELGNDSIEVFEGEVIADGMWIMESSAPDNALLFPEQVRITCQRSQMTCQEMTITLSPIQGIVFVMGPEEKEWTINSWNKDGLIASNGAGTLPLSDRCHNHVLTMTFSSGAVSTSNIPTHTRGCEAFKQTDSYRLVSGGYYVDTTPGNDADKPVPKK